MNFQKIRVINERINKNRKKLRELKDYKKREILRLIILIDEYKVKIERMK